METNNFKKNIANIIKQLEANNLDFYIVPSNDEYNSEYTAKHFNRLAYISNFTGSFGFALIGKNMGILCTDGRYILQASKEVDLTYFKVINIIDFNFDLLKGFGLNLYGANIGYDPALFNNFALTRFKNSNLISTSSNLVDNIWSERPALSDKKFYSYNIKYAGQSNFEKTNNLKNKFNLDKNEYILSTDSAYICWLLNIRGFDLLHTPIVLSYVLICLDSIMLYTENDYDYKLDSLGDLKLNTDIVIKNIKDFYSDLEKIKQNKVFLDKNFTNKKILNTLENQVHYDISELQIIQSIKNETEINLAKEGHIKDGISLIEAFAYLEDNLKKGVEISEKEVSDILINERSKQEGYVSESFNAIIGYESNGAVIHYKAGQNSKIIGKNLLLIDSGAQYNGCTTDCTRVLTINPPTKEQIEMYTRVLMGHIDLYNLKVPRNTMFSQLDSVARKYLWESNVDYAHGTGHGVGSFLGVHEAPISVSKYNKTILKANMIFSNEPGFYKEGEYGIRIENLIFTKEDQNGFLAFENLTYVPYCKKLIDFDMLNQTHKTYLTAYNKSIKEKIFENLSEVAKNWLLKQLF